MVLVPGDDAWETRDFVKQENSYDTKSKENNDQGAPCTHFWFEITIMEETFMDNIMVTVPAADVQEKHAKFDKHKGSHGAKNTGQPWSVHTIHDFWIEIIFLEANLMRNSMGVFPGVDSHEQ